MNAVVPVRVLIRISRPNLIRLGVVLLIANLLTQLLAWLYPVQHDLEVAWEKYAKWEVSSPIEVLPEDLDRVQRDFGPDMMLFADWESYLTGQWQGRAGVEAYVMPTEPEYFPLRTRVGYEDVGEDWIDIDIRAARTLGLQPGDTVGFVVSGDSAITLHVRGVYAVDLGFDPVVAVPAAAVFGKLSDPGDDEARTMNELFVSGMTVAEVESLLSQPFYAERLMDAGYYDGIADVTTLGVESRAERLRQAESFSSANLGLIAAISMLSALGLIGMILREISVFIGSLSRTISTLHRLGTSQARLWVPAALLAFSLAALGLASGAAAALLAFLNGLTGSTFPPTLLPTFLGANAAVLLLCAGCVGCASSFMRRRGADR